MTDEIKLVTLAEYNAMTPKQQGYVCYMQAEWPGSELKGQENPYPERTPERAEWNQGALIGVQQAQDADD